MRRIFAQATKELTQLLRDRLAVMLALLLPVVLLLLQTTAVALGLISSLASIRDREAVPRDGAGDRP